MTDNPILLLCLLSKNSFNKTILFLMKFYSHDLFVELIPCNTKFLAIYVAIGFQSKVDAIIIIIIWLSRSRIQTSNYYLVIQPLSGYPDFELLSGYPDLELQTKIGDLKTVTWFSFGQLCDFSITQSLVQALTLLSSTGIHSYSTVLNMPFAKSLAFLSFVIIIRIRLIVSFIPPPQHPITTGTIKMVTPGRLSLSSNDNC